MQDLLSCWKGNGPSYLDFIRPPLRKDKDRQGKARKGKERKRWEGEGNAREERDEREGKKRRKGNRIGIKER